MNRRMATTLILLLVAVRLTAQTVDKPETTNHIHKLENPMSLQYLEDNLKKESPRLMLTKELKRDLKRKIEERPEVANYYAAIKLNANSVFEEPLLQRIKTGRRLLSVSREMLHRMG
ncbi:MAG: hypothetical protein HKN76_09465, partial [Saprospiraceae bacterium]|nr:hypothetical protein [Saprospiraceae bacterium]